VLNEEMEARVPSPPRTQFIGCDGIGKFNGKIALRLK